QAPLQHSSRPSDGPSATGASLARALPRRGSSSTATRTLPPPAGEAKRPSDSLFAQMERLFRGVQVVKVHCGNAAVVAAEDAAAAGLVDENPLDLASPTHDRLPATALAAVVAASLEPKLRHAVVTTYAHDTGEP